MKVNQGYQNIWLDFALTALLEYFTHTLKVNVELLTIFMWR